MVYSDSEIKRQLDYLGNEFTIETKKGSEFIGMEKGYYRLKGDYGIFGKPAPYRGALQKIGLYTKGGFIAAQRGGPGGVPFHKAFFQAGKQTPWMGISQREAKLHLTNYLFGMKGGMGRRFRKVWNQASADIQDLEMNVIFYDNLIMGCEGYKNYIEDAGAFVAEHAGGIMGDHIKEQYFSAGKHEWPKLTLGTLNKKARNREGYRMQGVRMPTIAVPMWGITSTQDLPHDWENYTYKFANWPEGAAGMIRSAGFLAIQPGQFGRSPTTMRTGQFINRKQYTTWRSKSGRKSGIPYGGYDKKTHLAVERRMYAPMDRASMMDVVAHLAPTAMYSQNKEGTIRVSVGDILEPFGNIPWVFNHETGYTTNKGAKVPARPTLGPGIKNGVNDVTRLMREYIKDGNRKIREGIAISGSKVWSSSQIDSMYNLWYTMDVYKKYVGMSGIRAPTHAVYTRDDVGMINQKVKASKTQVRSMFNTRHIWWLLPPSKYYHYVGMAFDIASVVGGGFWSLGAVQAWIQAMSVGMMGARMGTPVPFTEKAQRRKFRKGLYTRAGYHRTGSLGTGRGRG